MKNSNTQYPITNTQYRLSRKARKGFTHQNFSKKNLGGFTHQNFLKKNLGGFTLIEALIALSILIIGILSAFILVIRALYNVSIIQSRLTASFLAQEGIELVREIRDSNFLQNLNGQEVDWRDGFKEDGDYIIESKVGSNEPIKLQSITNEVPYFYYDSLSRVYNYSSGEPTTFKRKIKISTVNNDEVRVESIIEWRAKNIDFNLVIEDHLFNWLKS